MNIKDRGYFLFLVTLFMLPNVLVFRRPDLVLYALAFLQSCALATIMSVGVTLIRRRGYRLAAKILLAAAPVLFVAVDTACILSTHTQLTAPSVMLMQETDSREAAGFFAQYMPAAVWLKFAAIIVLFVLTIKCLTVLWDRISKNRTADGIITGLIVACSVGGLTVDILTYGFLACKDYTTLTIRLGQDTFIPGYNRLRQLENADPLTRSLLIHKTINTINAGYEQWCDKQQATWQTTPATPGEGDFNIVVVIGESFIRAHAQVYGYYLPTTPGLQAEKEAGNLVVFDDVTAPGNFTTASLRNVMNLNNVSCAEPWFDGIYFPMLVKKAGRDVLHFDNQALPASTDVGLTQIFYNDLNLNEVYDMVGDSVFSDDMPFIRYVDRQLDQCTRSGKKMVIYHLLGQHFPYRARYTGPGRFKAGDITAGKPWLDDERRQLVADYDNATLHNDSVMARLLKRWRDTPTVLFYFSDHGEDVWDLGHAGARNKAFPNDAAWLDRQFHIPFMVWMSDSFIENNPEKAAKIRAAAHRRGGTTDLLGYMILGLVDPDSPYYRSDRDFLSEQYKPFERVTTEGYRYDRIVTRSARQPRQQEQ